MERLFGSAVIVLAGCGLGPFAGEGGGADHLPTVGGGPYGKLPLDLSTPADEPYVIADSGADVSDPSIRLRDGGGFRLWFQRRPALGGAAEIHYAELAALTELPEVGPRLALAAELDWEGGEVRAPTALARGERVILYYEAGDPPAIGRAVSTDGGATFARDPEPVIASGRRPSAIEAEGIVYLFFEVPGEPGIFVATSVDGIELDAEPVPVLGASGVPESFDRAAVESPGAVVVRTRAGRLHFGLFYDGRSGEVDDDGNPVVAIGYAGGFSPFELERFAGGEPILHPLAPSERGASVVLEPDRGHLVFAEPRGARIRVAAAAHP